MNPRRQGRIGAAMLIVALVWGVGCVWWWALFGMDSEIGAATFATCAALALPELWLVMNS